MRRLVALLAILLGGCPICDWDTELKIVGGEAPVAPGGELSLELRNEGWLAGPTKCRGHWYVNGVEGGDGTFGTIDRCGLFTAPAQPIAKTVTVEAMEYPPGTCADCCPWATRDVQVLTQTTNLR
jgi:hypothetical protein